jgi:mannose-6-phosphate isomerase-like protein (cupin superfamily)
MEIKKWQDGESFEAQGSKMYWVFWPGNGHNALTLHFNILKPGESFRMHNHLYSEDVISVIKGNGKALTSEGEMDIEAGQSLFARVGELHGFKNTGKEDMITLGSQSPADLNLYEKGGWHFKK